MSSLEPSDALMWDQSSLRGPVVSTWRVLGLLCSEVDYVLVVDVVTVVEMHKERWPGQVTRAV